MEGKADNALHHQARVARLTGGETSELNHQVIFEVLRLSRRGLAFPEIADAMLARGYPSGHAPSIRALELLYRSGIRVLLLGILRNRPPDGLPEDLWPPQDLRQHLADCCNEGAGYREAIATLAAWVQGEVRSGG